MHRRSRSSAFVALGVVLLVVPVVALASGCRKKPAMNRQGCEAMLASANAAMQTLEVTCNRPRTCVEDRDCVELERPSCISFCSGMAFPANEAAIVRQRITESEARECRPWSDADCATISPRPIASCANLQPRCEDTRCTMVFH